MCFCAPVCDYLTQVVYESLAQCTLPHQYSMSAHAEHPGPSPPRPFTRRILTKRQLQCSIAAPFNPRLLRHSTTSQD
eukprot:1546155-Pyramimonas_sp.AAC.3